MIKKGEVNLHLVIRYIDGKTYKVRGVLKDKSTKLMQQCN